MTTLPLPVIPVKTLVTQADIIASGPQIPAIVRVRMFSPKEWEEFTLEWAHSLKPKYQSVEKCAGAGDMGRDVIAFEIAGQSDPWDNYQCKHYDHPLAPGDIWLELGKLCHYTYMGEYTFPRAYYFVSPHGVGPALSKLLHSPAKLKDELLKLWDDKCKDDIGDQPVQLDAGLRAHIVSLDFSKIHSMSPLTIIDEHRKTPWHAERFGGGLPQRPTAPIPPIAVAAHETKYVRALLDAYEDRLKIQIPTIPQLTDGKLKDHLNRSRLEFYNAEALREFSKDNVPQGTFEGLLDEVQNGVSDEIEANHTDSFERVLATVKQAKSLPLTSNPLVMRITNADKGGMCHQLANERGIKWRQ